MNKTTILLLGAKSKHSPLEAVPAELSRLKQLFTTNNDPELHVEYEPYVTRQLLGDLLRKLTDQISVLHFAGHAGAEQLQTDDEMVYAQHIAGILKTWDTKPSLLFLNGCNSAGQLEVFLDAGVSCVIATHNYIDDHEASQFAYEFYANLLAQQGTVTFSNAFDRAGALVLMGEARQARTLNLPNLKQGLEQDPNQEWDWGLFSLDESLPGKSTLIEVINSIQPQTETIAPSSTPTHKPLDFMSKAKQKQLNKRFEMLSTRLQELQKQRDLETRVEERLRLDAVIEQNQADLDKVQEELSQIFI